MSVESCEAAPGVGSTPSSRGSGNKWDAAWLLRDAGGRVEQGPGDSPALSCGELRSSRQSRILTPVAYKVSQAHVHVHVPSPSLPPPLECGNLKSKIPGIFSPYWTISDHLSANRFRKMPCTLSDLPTQCLPSAQPAVLGTIVSQNGCPSEVSQDHCA